MRSSKEIRRILIVRTDRLGDVVLTLPVLTILRSCYPNAHIAVLLKRYTGQIAEGNSELDEIIWYDDGASHVPFLEMRKILSEKKFDAAVVVYPRLRLALLMAASGIPIRIGTGYRYYSFLFNRRVYEHRRDARKHEVEYNIGLLRELNCRSEGEPVFHIHIPEDVRERVRRKVERISDGGVIVLHPGSGGSAREWPPESFGALGKLLAGDDTVSVLVVGTGNEERTVSRVVGLMGGKGTAMIDRLSVKEYAALLAESVLFVSNSTGPIHIAAAVGTPVIGLYPQHTAMSVRRWGPWTKNKRIFVPERPVDCRDCVRRGDGVCECMASIRVQDVYEAATEILGQRVRSSPGPLRRERPA